MGPDILSKVRHQYCLALRKTILAITWSSPLDAKVGKTFLPDEIHLKESFGGVLHGGILLEGYGTKSKAY